MSTAVPPPLKKNSGEGVAVHRLLGHQAQGFADSRPQINESNSTLY